MNVPPKYRIPLMALGMISLVTAIWGGLQRMGVDLPTLRSSLPVHHGPLMVCGFLGTVIALERAVALGRVWGYVSPLSTGIGGVLLIAGAFLPLAQAFMLMGSIVLSLVFLFFLYRQFSLFLSIMTLGVFSWVTGNILWLLGGQIQDVIWWWMGFLIFTIAGERLELGRLLLLSKLKQGLLLFAITLTLAGTVNLSLKIEAGMVTFGLGVLFIAIWLSLNDIARKTFRNVGLPRFVAINLFAGYFWLGICGLLIIFNSVVRTGFYYDAYLHAFFLGFVFSMIFGHAPIIFPSVLGKEMPFRHAFYLHAILLHLFLIVRLTGDLLNVPLLRQGGGILNGITLILFLANNVIAIRSAELEKKRTSSL